MGKTTSILKNTAGNDDDNGFKDYREFAARMNNIGNKRSAVITNSNNNKTNRRISFAEFDGRVYMFNNNNDDGNFATNGNDDVDDIENSHECEKHSIYCECGGSGVGCQCSSKCFC